MTAETTTAQPGRRALRWGASLLAAAVLSACAGGSTRPDPAELPANPAVVSAGQDWSVRLGDGVSFPMRPHVQDRQVTLAADDGTVLTLDAATGRVLNRANLGTPLTAGVGSDGRISAVVTRSNEVVAVQDGNELWRYRLPTQSYTPPLVAGGRVFVLGANRALFALDGRNGALIWRQDRPAEPLVLRQAGVLLAVGNQLVSGFAGRLAGVDPDSGSVMWEAPIASPRGVNDVERLVDLVGSATRDSTAVCARAFQSAVGCVDSYTGRLMWNRPASGETGLASDGQRLFGVESDGRVVAWNATNGERAWTNEQLRWRRLGAPLALGRSVILGESTGAVHMLSREDGSVIGRLNTDSSGVAGAPVVAGNTLVVVTRNGGVYGFVPR